MKLTNEKDKERRSRLIYSIYRPNIDIKRSEIAEASGYTPEYISRLISGERRVSDEAAKNLATVLNVREEYLRAEDEYMTYDDFNKIMAQADKLATSINHAAQEIGFIYLDSNVAHNERSLADTTDIGLLSFIRSYSTKNERSLINICDKKWIDITNEEYKSLCDDITEFIQFKIQQVYKHHTQNTIPDEVE